MPGSSLITYGPASSGTGTFPAGSVYVDTTNNAVRVHDGSTNGGVYQPYDPLRNLVTFQLSAASGPVFSDLSGNNLPLANTSVTTTATTQQGYSQSATFNGSALLTCATAGSAVTFPGDFTVETWAYLTQKSLTNVLVCFGTPAAGGSANRCTLYTTPTNGFLAVDSVAGGITSSTAPSLNQWNHIAMVRASGTLSLYLNGAFVTSTANSTSYTDGYLIIGRDSNSTSFSFLQNGQVVGLRISKVARYTAPYSPPVIPFALLGPQR